ncbi:MAG: gamma-glutamylcyclotransferase [Lautropia sp.]|nr:gamma-glutamylcyclotransferase [Lautropia sp.]MDL1908012.1 gamma-glutamylcyclotransferase [Betaproteobacteria bacterium PRO1]
MLGCMVCMHPASVATDWVFGYGSLIWNPEIDFERAEVARVHGYHRAFCISSTRYRGTPAQPGLVLGLDRGGSCVGVAYRLTASRRDAAIRHLYQREIPDWDERVYLPVVLEARLPCGTRIDALTFTADRDRPSYQRLDDDEILQRLGCCAGQRGANRDYAINTWRALEARGVRDARLEQIARRLLASEHRRRETVAA